MMFRSSLVRFNLTKLLFNTFILAFVCICRMRTQNIFCQYMLFLKNVITFVASLQGNKFENTNQRYYYHPDRALC